tara:strand:- start:489 stop:701 length:213 start_codon:yes stop_codon:yes gene_type:complete
MSVKETITEINSYTALNINENYKLNNMTLDDIAFEIANNREYIEQATVLIKKTLLENDMGFIKYFNPDSK